ncbi:MAG TPA: DNA ligase D [Gaiellaceae bacterium]|nr:DNA ligase D [Gaiellaceae bacterium]
MARLREYERKRSKGATPEPFGDGDGSSSKPMFVVQRHDARRLHYDFRLERDGALASWAVPKGVPLEPGQRHLAVHVEDHPLEYATFAGEIPAGQYGAGTVEIWDQGTYELLEEKRDGGLTVRLDGERLQGVWTLVPAKLDGDEKNWLLLRKQDESAPASRRRGTEYVPMLATLAEDVPSGAAWSHEVKWDGYRAIARIAGGDATLTSRRGLDMTERFKVVARALERAVRTPDVVLDGEVCALDDEGRASFSVMQQGKGPLVLYVFDVLEIDGAAVVDLPLRERRERLEEVVDFKGAIRLSQAFDDGDALFEAAKEQGLEGIVSKKVESRYQPGKRTREWLKVKATGRQEFLVAGYTKGQGRRAGRFGSLVLAVRKGKELEYVGNVGSGFTEDEIDRLLAKLRPLESDTPPFRDVPKIPRVRKGDIVWVEPRLVAEVKFAEWTHDGRLRAPVYEGLREDKEATDVHREEPLPDEIRKGKRTLKLSNLDKPFWPEEGITKGDLIAYYREVAPVLVQHLRDRPFTMKRYPDGWQGKHFFQKDAPSHMPEWIPTFTYRSTSRQTREKRTLRYPLVNDELALLWMANMGCIDMNTWYSRADKPERPDWVLFDLDPSPDVGFPEVVRVALLVKDVLDALGLVGLPKTSGSDGFHVLVPIQRRHTYGQTREFAEIVAGTLARLHPGLVTTEWAKAKRRGVLIDSNQNGEGKTIASVYSVRPNAGAPVSTPLRWEEVTEDIDPASFTMDVVLGRVERDGDLFADVLELKQALGPALREIK